MKTFTNKNITEKYIRNKGWIRCDVAATLQSVQSLLLEDVEQVSIDGSDYSIRELDENLEAESRW